MLGLASTLTKGGASLLTFVKDNLKLYLDFNSKKSDTLKFPSEGSTSFDGSDDNMAISHSSDLSFGTNPHTISAWAKLDVLANFKTIISKRQTGGTATDYNLSVGANGIVYTYNGSATAQTATGVISTGSWFHYALVYDGSAYQLYINGSAVAWASGTTTSGASNSHDVAIGWDRTGNYWDGQIANVALWSRELSPEEIQSIKNKSYSQLKGVEKTSLVAWWALDTDFNDSKGSNNGTNNGATINNTVYGGNAPILPRAVDVAKEGQADNIGNGSALFNGTSDIIDIGSNSILDNVFVGGATITAWIKPSSDGENSLGRIFDKSDSTSGTDGWHLVILAESSGSCDLRFGHGRATTTGIWDTTNTEVNIDEWTHVAVTYNNSSTDNNATYYINGISVAVTEFSTPSGNAVDDSSRNLFIGNNTGLDRTFDGSIAGAGIWKGELTQSQIQSIIESTSYSKIPADVKSTLTQISLRDFTGVADGTDPTTLSYIFAYGVPGEKTIDNERLKIVDSNNTGVYWKETGLTSSKLYKITVEATGDVASAGVYSSDLSFTLSNGTFTGYVTGKTQIIVYLRANNNSAGTTFYDNLKTEEVTNDIVAYYPLDGSSEVKGLSFAYADKVTFTQQTFTGAFSIMCWFNGDVNTDYKRLFADSSPPSGTNDILVKDTNGQIAIRINGGYKANINSVPNNTWSHLAYTRDSSGNIKAYLNGVQSSTSTSTDTFTLDNIGGDGGGAVMKMSSASMYNVEKSADEVLSIYNEGIGGDESSNSGLQLYYKLDNTSTITDLSGNGNNGTVTGATLISAGTTDSVGNNDGGLY